MTVSNDIVIYIPEEKQTYCEICNKQLKSKNALAGHIGAGHKVCFEDYLVKYYNNNIKPTCPICNKTTRYVRGKYSFKRYCTDHANEARSDWSKNNGYGAKIDAGWKRGLTKETNESIRKHSEYMKGENNPFYGKRHNPETYKSISSKRATKTRISIEEFENRKNSQDVICLSDYTTYINSVSRNLKYFCKSCQNIYDASLMWHDCTYCNKPSSAQEDEITQYLDSVNLKYVKNTRDVIQPQELDIYIEQAKLAIEYNGLYWHTEEKGRHNTYHLNKTISCRNKEISLIHIFSDEWNNKKEIIMSIINHKLGLNINRINTRKMDVIEAKSNKELKDFFDRTHISGYTSFITAFYLKDPITDEIVAALSLRKPFIKKYGSKTVEIARFSTKLNSSVPGAFSRLLKYCIKWSKQEGYDKILTYADLRFGNGDVYNKNKFNFVGSTKVDYWYTDGKQRYNRFKFRAQRGKPEKIVAQENGVYKIYGCGSNIYELKL